MSTVFSTLSLNHNYGTEDFHANHQENHQIYSSIFRDAANSPYHKDLDFDLSDVISKAVNSLKGNYQSKSCSKQANIRNPCGICCKSVNKNQHGIFCTTCLKWYHRKCNGTSLKDYESLRNEDDDIPWQCILCLIDDNASKFPFGYLSSMELNDFNGLDLPSQLKLLPSYELRSKLSGIPNLDNFDIEENHIRAVNSNYYDLHDFIKLTNSVKKCLSLFHVNIRSLSKHIDELKNVLHASKIIFDFIGVSETKQLINKDFISNVDIEGYHVYSQPSKSSSGGVAIYVNNKLDHFRKDDLSVIEDDFESLWIEIKNNRGKNIMCGCIYRHPNRDPDNFFEYIENTLSKIDNNKYQIFIMGDYNIDLLQYEHSSLSNDFINTMISKSFLPYILQPTRVTDHSATVIDNIFSNVTDCETVSGNLTTLISDHFIQFFIIKKKYISYKSCNYYTRDYSNFGKEKLIYDYSLIDWTSLSDPQISVDDHFDYLYEKTSECIDTHVPKKKVTKKYLKLRSKPWINVRIQKLMSYRDKLFSEMNKHPTQSNKYLYHKFRNRVVSEQRRGKKSYFQEYFEKHKTNMKMLWHGIRSIVNTSNKNQASHISQLNVNGKLISDPVIMANIFNKYFVNVGCNIDKSIPRTKKSALDYLKK